MMLYNIPDPTPPALVQFGLTQEQVKERWQFANAHSAWVEQQARLSIDVWRAELLLEQLEESRRLERCWEALYGAHAAPRYGKDQAYDWLTRQIGREAFGYGHMPPPVPLWRFEER